MKRRGFDRVNDEFIEFPLSTPARKIRRLDADLLPIPDVEESEIGMAMEDPPMANPSYGRSGVVIEELPDKPVNAETAIVLYNPSKFESPILLQPSNFSVSVDPNLISNFKTQHWWSDRSLPECRDSAAARESMAIIPWEEPIQLPTGRQELVPASEPDHVSDMMEDEEMDEVSMDIQESGSNVEASGTNLDDGLQMHQWQRQHCLIPRPPQNSTPPIVWNR